MNSHALDKVIGCFAQMPGVGKKTAQRLAYFMLSREEAFAFEFASALTELKRSLRWCSRCYNISGEELCGICSKPERHLDLLCIVEDAVNVTNVERSGSFNGIYHVLQGALSPMNDIGPDDLRIKELFGRLTEGTIEEIILATNPTVEGEATAMYIAESIRDFPIKTTRIAVGVPIGGNLDYCDEITMAKAIENRRAI